MMAPVQFHEHQPSDSRQVQFLQTEDSSAVSVEHTKDTKRIYFGSYKRVIGGSILALCCLAPVAVFIGQHAAKPESQTSDNLRRHSAFIRAPRAGSLTAAPSKTAMNAYVPVDWKPSGADHASKRNSANANRWQGWKPWQNRRNQQRVSQAEGVARRSTAQQVETFVAEDWASAVDDASGNTYYFNTKTGESSWVWPPPAAAAAPPSAPSADASALHTAATHMDVTTVSAILQQGLEMDEATTDAAFWAVVKEVDRAEAADQPLSADVPRMLHHIFDSDMRHLLRREQHRTNITCMQPKLSGIEAAAQNIDYVLDDSRMADMPLKQGRVCKNGRCCDACSRNIFPQFARDEEVSLETFPGLASFTFNDVEKVGTATILQFMRLMERVRRMIAHEYGLPLGTVLTVQAYSRTYVAGTSQTGGGGSEGDTVTLHADEETHSNYHYSSVLYLNTQGEEYEGGDFIFNDPKPSDESSVDAAVADVPSDEANDIDGSQDGLSTEDGWMRTDIGFDPNKDDGDILGFEASPDDEDDWLSPELAAQLAGLEDDDTGDIITAADIAKARSENRILTPFHPTKGAGVIFSSGWENMHEVHKVTSGTRYAVPSFWTTEPVPGAAYEQMGKGKPKTDEDIADDWLHLLLAHRTESPLEAMGRVKELLMKWHYMCTPLSEHSSGVTALEAMGEDAGYE